MGIAIPFTWRVAMQEVSQDILKYKFLYLKNCGVGKLSN